ncbi:MAG: hypothetical protein AB1333_04815 [Patescibacteria group bacterium]
MKIISTIAIILGVICFVLGAISTQSMILLGARTWAAGSGLLLLLAIALNTSK